MLSEQRATRETRPVSAVRRPPIRPWWRRWPALVVLLPNFALMVVFNYYPAASALFHSFFNWRPGYTSPFNGLTNYAQIQSDGVFLQPFVNVAKLFVFGITLAMAIPFIVAELVIRLKSARLQYIFRALLILPMAFPGIVTLLLWGFMFEPSSGLLNALLHGVGIKGLVQRKPRTGC